MRERPILFSGEMVRAILREENPKTVTRRLIPSPVENELGLRGWRDRWGNLNTPGRHPYGDPGDRLWVRETFYCDHYEYPNGDRKEMGEMLYYRAESGIDGAGRNGDNCWTGFSLETMRVSWRPAIHMPRWASRLTLEVLSVRVERLQEIAEEDAKAEGVLPFAEAYSGISMDQTLTSGERCGDEPHRASFAILWDELNGDRANWKSNPWVWRVEFRRLEVAHV
jgi:hypothetical protein